MAKRKIAIHLSLILCVIVLFSVLSGSVPSHTADFYVDDYAGVLSEETKSHIMSTAVQLENETTAQVVVLTVESLNGKDISDFAVDTFRSWGIGDKDKNNGVLIVLSVGDREMWVTTGYGVEGTLTDTRLGQLRDTYAIPYYSNNDFDTGTKLLFDAIVNELRTEEYGLEPLSEFGESGEYYNEPVELSDGAFIVLICFWAIPFIVFPGVKIFQLVKYLKLRSLDKKNGTNEAEKYRKKIKNVRESTNYRGGGGFGGGFRGGGGFGGGGGFSGGGGSTGGGGAGGRF